MATTPVQTRLDIILAKALDMRAREAGTTRAEVVRELLEAALAAPQPARPVPATDAALDHIANELAALAVRVDASLAASRSAHAAARLGALMLLPTDQQAAFVEKLGKAVRP